MSIPYGQEYDEDGLPVPGSHLGVGTGNQGMIRAEYVDIRALLEGGLPEPVAPNVLHRNDGVALLYSEKANTLFGESEAGKTWIAQCGIVSTLRDGGSAVFLDFDHNGAIETAQRLIALGAPVEALKDMKRFRYIEPDGQISVLDVVSDCSEWRPDYVLIDSIGELMAMFKASSNSPDDFTDVHQRTIKPLFAAGACVVLIDHLPKNPDSKAAGPTGTAAKKRVLGGTQLRVTADAPFKPGDECTAYISVAKDRPGGLRKHCPPADGRAEPIAAVFKMRPDAHKGIEWELRAPRGSERTPASQELIRRLSELDPPPSSAEDAAKRLKVRKAAILAPYRQWKDGSSQFPPLGGNREPEPVSNVQPLFSEASNDPE